MLLMQALINTCLLIATDGVLGDLTLKSTGTIALI
jgi:hypothetical protein